MSPTEFLEKLEVEELKSVYFLYGEERFYISEIIRVLKRKIFTEKNEDLNIEVFDAKISALDDWLRAANTLSLFGGRKMVLVRDLQTALFDKKSAEPLLDYIGNPAIGTCLVLTSDKVDRKRKLDKMLVGLKTAVDCSNFSEAILPRWLQSRAKSMGVQLSPNTARMMVDRVGSRPGLLAMELDKLIAYAGDEKKLDETSVGEVVGFFKLENVFELTKALKERNPIEALRLLGKQLHHGEEPLKILGAIIWQFRFIWEVKHHMQRRLPAEQIAKAMNSRPFIVEKTLPFAKGFSQRELRAGFGSLLEADWALKNSGGQPERIMKGLVLNLCSGF